MPLVVLNLVVIHNLVVILNQDFLVSKLLGLASQVTNHLVDINLLEVTSPQVDGFLPKVKYLWATDHPIPKEDLQGTIQEVECQNSSLQH